MLHALSKQEDGSSPRLRGTPLDVGGQTMAERFIPAPAGNTSSGCRRLRPASVHPRACGEHVLLQQLFGQITGSSPRLRGTRFLSNFWDCPIRFIPAPAGNTPASRRYRSPGPVHPRACGEHAIGYHLVIAQYGSSPRLRGTLVQGLLYLFRLRFIPAPAGNTA